MSGKHDSHPSLYQGRCQGMAKRASRKMVKKELGKLEMKKEKRKKKKGEIEALFSEAEMLNMSLMPSEVYYPH